MKYAYPIDKHGDQCGPTKSFADDQWERLKSVNPKFRWKEDPTEGNRKTVELVTEKETEAEEKSFAEYAKKLTKKQVKTYFDESQVPYDSKDNAGQLKDLLYSALEGDVDKLIRIFDLE